MNEASTWAEALAWLDAGEPVALATVVAVRGTAPRAPGTRLAIGPGGALAGAVSGGCVDGRVIEAAEAILADGGPGIVLPFRGGDGDPLEPGLPCGGGIDVWVDRLRPGSAAAAYGALCETGGRGVLISALEGPGAVLVRADGEGQTDGAFPSGAAEGAAWALAEARLWGGAAGLATLPGGVAVWIDVCAPPPRLLIFGATDHAAALVRVAGAVGFDSWVVDPRGRFARPERFPGAAGVVAAWPAKALPAVGGIDAATAVVVLAHDVKLDDAALAVALPSEAFYVGAMGSRTAQARRRARLLDAGVTEAQLARLAGPVGLDLGGSSAGETALSVMAEVVAVANGRAGGRLRDAAGPIHAGA